MSKVFMIYDCKAESYGVFPVLFFLNAGEALREWTVAANDDKSKICMFPADFTLFEVGEFDHKTGVIKMHESKISLGTALEYKKQAVSHAPLLEAINGQKAGE